MENTELNYSTNSNADTVAEVGKKITSPDLLDEMSELFKCFADPTRLKIINALLLSELCVGELQMVMSMTQPAVSHHLKQLRQLRLVKCRREGKATFYSLNDYHIQLLFDLAKTHQSEEHKE